MKKHRLLNESVRLLADNRPIASELLARLNMIHDRAFDACPIFIYIDNHFELLKIDQITLENNQIHLNGPRDLRQVFTGEPFATVAGLKQFLSNNPTAMLSGYNHNRLYYCDAFKFVIWSLSYNVSRTAIERIELGLLELFEPFENPLFPLTRDSLQTLLQNATEVYNGKNQTTKARAEQAFNNVFHNAAFFQFITCNDQEILQNIKNACTGQTNQQAQPPPMNAQVMVMAPNQRAVSSCLLVAGKQTFQEFATWWASAPQELKNSFPNTITTIYYTQFPGDTTSENANSDSTIRRTTFVAYHLIGGTTGDLYIYGKVPPPRRRTPVYETIMVIRVGSKLSAFQPFIGYQNGRWHGHLYSLLVNAVNTSSTGLRVVYDPNGYLNWLYANLPAGKRGQLRGTGPGVPQTIGLNVTEDLTVGIPRTSQVPLTAEQQQAMDQANAEIAASQRRAAEAKAKATENLQKAKLTRDQIEAALPPILRRSEYAKSDLIVFWPGADNAGYEPPIQKGVDNSKPYILVNFPGTIDETFVGEDAKKMLEELDLWQFVQPIANRIVEVFGQEVDKHPELVLMFNNSIVNPA